jgi:hypothetical protein
MANPRGMTLPSALIRPATPLDPESADGDQGEPIEGSAEAQGRGAIEARTASRPRRRAPAKPSEKTAKRGVYLTDALWERLQLEAIRKRTNVSAIMGDCLDRNLPRLRIEREV